MIWYAHVFVYEVINFENLQSYTFKKYATCEKKHKK